MVGDRFVHQYLSLKNQANRLDRTLNGFGIEIIISFIMAIDIFHEFSFPC